MVSNRLPSTFICQNDIITELPSVGGMATGVSSIFPYSKEDVWVGWPGYISSNPKEKEEIQKIARGKQFQPIFLSKEEVRDYYEGFCNCVIWPTFHQLDEFIREKDEWWKSYKLVNEKFCDCILQIADCNSTIWINDFHLMLLPRLLKNKRAELNIGFFFHTPFPDERYFEGIHSNIEILTSLLYADSIGFYLEEYRSNFKKAIRRFLPEKRIMGNMFGTTLVGVFPIGIDFSKYNDLAKKNSVKLRCQELKKSLQGDIILSIDRLDYTKGIPEKLVAFETFLAKRNAISNNVTLFLVVVPSREGIRENQLLKECIDSLVKRVNSRFGSEKWKPVVYHYNSFLTEELSAFYSMADIMLITSKIDGMNLVSKEFLASKTDNKGVLVLSKKAGAAKELRNAVLVNPWSITSIVRGLTRAMKLKHRNGIKMRKMRNLIEKNNIDLWANNFYNSIRQ